MRDVTSLDHLRFAGNDLLLVAMESSEQGPMELHAGVKATHRGGMVRSRNSRLLRETSGAGEDMLRIIGF